VRLISAINRIYKACGLNDLEQLEDAPEYRPGVKVTPGAGRGLPQRSSENRGLTMAKDAIVSEDMAKKFATEKETPTPAG
jgi:hypothetical protein